MIDTNNNKKSNEEALPYELANKLFFYDPLNGGIYSKVNRGLKSRKWYNISYVGKELGSHQGYGYLLIRIGKYTYLSHRLAWLLYHGAWPYNQIDHINHNRKDNSIHNLREVTGHENHKNVTQYKNNTSGFTGVSWDSRSKKWRVLIFINGKQKQIGMFTCKQDAINLRKSANLKYDYHNNHGVK